jgi:hypothetical protein
MHGWFHMEIAGVNSNSEHVHPERPLRVSWLLRVFVIRERLRSNFPTSGGRRRISPRMQYKSMGSRSAPSCG